MADEDLLNAGAEVNAVNDDGMTALMLLVQHGNPDEAPLLSRALEKRRIDNRPRCKCGLREMGDIHERWIHDCPSY
jgi:ankyrin repeat protein